jgi:hypothetical protein
VKLDNIVAYWDKHNLAENRIECKDVVPAAFKSASSSQARASFEKAMDYIPLNALVYIVKEGLYQWESPADKPLVEAFKKKHLMSTSSTALHAAPGQAKTSPSSSSDVLGPRINNKDFF